MRKKPRFSAHSCVSWEAWPNAGMGGSGEKDRTSRWRIKNRMLSPFERNVKTSSP
jgi:hypothetical protein